MKKKTFGSHFLLLSLTVFALCYTALFLIEKREERNRERYLYNQAEDLATRTGDILSNASLRDKENALRFIYQGALEKEPALSFYQIGKVKAGQFEPFMAGKQSSGPLVLIHINDLFSKSGQMKAPFIEKDNHIIFHKDIYDKAVYRGKIFIGFNKEVFARSSTRNHLIIMSFALLLIITGVLVFSWYHRKEKKMIAEILNEIEDDRLLHSPGPIHRVKGMTDYSHLSSDQRDIREAISAGRK